MRSMTLQMPMITYIILMKMILFNKVPADDGDSLDGAHDEQTLMYLTLSEFNQGFF
ncbi:hypothetical protein Ct9H90mP29_07500 [bacterium]|nr:MAG: hypothetical protein Ct9H90mP29_07500 [bacterium]